MPDPTQPVQQGEAGHEAETTQGPAEHARHTRWWRHPAWSTAGRTAACIILLIVAVEMTVLLAWLLAAQHWDAAAKAGWFAGTGTFAAVVVALWQTISIQRRAKLDTQEAQERLSAELAAAEQRSTLELENARELHRLKSTTNATRLASSACTCASKSSSLP